MVQPESSISHILAQCQQIIDKIHRVYWKVVGILQMHIWLVKCGCCSGVGGQIAKVRLCVWLLELFFYTTAWPPVVTHPSTYTLRRTSARKKKEMSRDTASNAFPTSLLLAGRERSTITSTKSTMINTTPNILEEKGQHHQLFASQRNDI